MIDILTNKTEALNETMLLDACPHAFKKSNRWSDYASMLFFTGDTSNWKWKTVNEETKNLQLRHLYGILNTIILSHEDKMAIAGWMLSEMLTEVPS